ncbi:MAG: hypothetical protein OEU26_28880, partial [Candidatus Tectomicrobia bacterium]|nr:hypothetical protein [Candidatus Tectomicrobia bacterium]
IGIFSSRRYETALEGEQENIVVSTKFGDVAVLTGMVGSQQAPFIRRFGWEDHLASDVVNHAAHALAFRVLGARQVLMGW